ncbi:Rtp1p [Sugiyamaella lignohabitans]|uniref:Rtp1p n=1 Tax=Sugiyamaella lignohabitans TaxID=796027 RepID=A0A167CHW3_9ASCO|nr:Rtp1p [Sugiyamaella lignohabitans]ANB11722.1 Rtp1p [Sugiyamaella lignohabitans]
MIPGDDRSKIKVQSLKGPLGNMPSTQKELDSIFESAQTWLTAGGVSTDENRLEKLYQASGLTTGSLALDIDEKRTIVIGKVLDYLVSIQKETLAIASKSASGETSTSDLIVISLHDMKIFNALTNLLVIEGIYPCLSDGVGIPLELRFKGKKTIAKVNSSTARSLLKEIMTRILTLITTAGDVRDIILLGTYSSDFICGSIELAYKPGHEDERHLYQPLFQSVTDQMDTYTLFSSYLSLLRPGTPPWFREVVSHNLALIPVVRSDGIRGLLDFIGGLRESEQISLDQLNKVVRILRASPKGMDLGKYQKALSDQFINLLSNPPLTPSGNNMIVATVYVIYSLFDQRPGLLENFQQSLVDGLVPKFGSEEKNEIIRSENDVDRYLTIFSHLVKDVSQPELLERIRSKVIVSLWLLLTFLNGSKRPIQTICELIVSLLNVDASSSQSSEDASKIVHSLLINSQGTDDNNQWTYGGGPNGGVVIKKAPNTISNSMEMIQAAFDQLDQRVELFMSILNQKLDPKVISGLFIIIVKRWLVKRTELENDDTDPFSALVNVKIIEKIANEQKEHLMKSPKEIIDLISSMITEYAINLQDDLERAKVVKNSANKPTVQGLSSITSRASLPQDSDDELSDNDGDSDDENDTDDQGEVVSICLSLITGLIMEEVSQKDLDLLRKILPQLEWLSENGPTYLKDKVLTAIDILKNPQNVLGDGEEEDFSDSTAVYNKALASLEDPIIPVRAHGIHLLRTLIRNRDPIINLESALRIFIGQLKDEDSFIYLNSIKALEDLVDVYGYEIVLPVVLGHYLDPKVGIDERLRTGEVILRIIQRLDEMLTGEAVQMIVDALLSIVSVRSNQTSSPDSTPDSRLRMSAMSVLGATCEINPLGVGKYLPDIVDCAVGILTFEQSDDMAIMRRSAVVLIGSLAKGFETLDGIPRREIDRVLTRIRYAKDTDNDPLVRVQAAFAVGIGSSGRGGASDSASGTGSSGKGGASDSASGTGSSGNGGASGSVSGTGSSGKGGASDSASGTGSSGKGGASDSASGTGSSGKGGASDSASGTGSSGNGGASGSVSGTGSSGNGGASGSVSRTGSSRNGGASGSASGTGSSGNGGASGSVSGTGSFGRGGSSGTGSKGRGGASGSVSGTGSKGSGGISSRSPESKV